MATVLSLTLLALTANANAQYTETVLYNFGATGDSVFPMSGLIFDGSGNLFGATEVGGSNDSGDAYELSPSSGGGWTENILYSFFGGTGVSEPSGNLIFDANGNLYGLSKAGGSNRSGTVFEISPTSSGSWKQTILHNFGGGTDGTIPEGTPIFDAKGNLYATTAVGGLGHGTVVELSPSASGHWTEKIIYNFTGGSDGSEPGGNLVFDAAGNLYGTAFGGGGTTTCTTGCGTVFRLTPMGSMWRFTRVFAFGGHDGTYSSALTMDGAGNLYGVAREAGSRNVAGVAATSSNSLCRVQMAFGRKAFCTTSPTKTTGPLQPDWFWTLPAIFSVRPAPGVPMAREPFLSSVQRPAAAGLFPCCTAFKVKPTVAYRLRA